MFSFIIYIHSPHEFLSPGIKKTFLRTKVQVNQSGRWLIFWLLVIPISTAKFKGIKKKLQSLRTIKILKSDL